MEIREWFGFQGRVNRSSYALAGIFRSSPQVQPRPLVRPSTDPYAVDPLELSLSGPRASRFDSFLYPPEPIPRAPRPHGDSLRLVRNSMTVKRVRDAGLNLCWSSCFCSGGEYTCFLLFLCLVPGREQTVSALGPRSLLLRSLLPSSNGESQFSLRLTAAGVGAAFGALMISRNGYLRVDTLPGYPVLYGISFCLALWLRRASAFRAVHRSCDVERGAGQSDIDRNCGRWPRLYLDGHPNWNRTSGIGRHLSPIACRTI